VTLAGLAVAVIVALLAPAAYHPTRQGHDAGFTYGYLPSIVARGDLDFTYDAYPFNAVLPHTTTGRTQNIFAIGPAVWWSPAFLMAHGLGAAKRWATRSATGRSPGELCHQTRTGSHIKDTRAGVEPDLGHQVAGQGREPGHGDVFIGLGDLVVGAPASRSQQGPSTPDRYRTWSAR
jgi:hypothetical protein